MAFEIASTNLVVELGIILALLIGWQFTAAEFVGGPIMIAFLALLFRRLLRPGQLKKAREQADRGLAGRMEGHAEMDMAVTEGSIWSRLTSAKGSTATSHYFGRDDRPTFTVGDPGLALVPKLGVNPGGGGLYSPTHQGTFRLRIRLWQWKSSRGGR